MAMAKKAAIVVVLAVVAAQAVVQLAAAVDHPVGGDGSWNAGGNGYDAWSANQTFKQGDTLSFKYSASHDVTEVTKAGYDACSGGAASNAVVKSYAGTSATVKLAAPGKRYFICSVPGHCDAGMKLEVTVVAVAAAAAPAPSKPRHQTSVPPPTPSPSPAPAPAPDATSTDEQLPNVAAPSPKSSDAAAALGGKAALAAGLAVAAALAM